MDCEVRWSVAGAQLCSSQNHGFSALVVSQHAPTYCQRAPNIIAISFIRARQLHCGATARFPSIVFRSPQKTTRSARGPGCALSDW